jgi:protein-tyrosine phosphatase
MTPHPRPPSSNPVTGCFPNRVLIVCMGNICRSPTAEAVLRSHLRKAGLQIQVDSAGTEDYHIGAAPDSRSIKHASLRGYDLGGLRARQVNPSDFTEFDLILAADDANLAELNRRCPREHQHKLSLFLENAAVPDPYYGGIEGFEKVLDLIESRAAALVQMWSLALA